MKKRKFWSARSTVVVLRFLTFGLNLWPHFVYQILVKISESGCSTPTKFCNIFILQSKKKRRRRLHNFKCSHYQLKTTGSTNHQWCIQQLETKSFVPRPTPCKLLHNSIQNFADVLATYAIRTPYTYNTFSKILTNFEEFLRI